LKALSESIGFRMRMFAVEKGSDTIGVLPILLRRRGPISTANYLPIAHAGPLLRDATALTDVLTAAEPFLLRQLTVATKWAFAPGVPIVSEPLSELGFEVKSIENFFVPAGRSTTEQMGSIARKQRKELVACQSLGMEASAADIREIKDWFASQVAAPYTKLGVIPEYTQAAGLRLVQLLGTDPRMLWRSVRDNHGQLIAVTACIIDTDRLYGWMIVGGHSTRPSPHIFAYWDVIEWALSHGLSCDLALAPTDGIRSYKLRMGAVSEPCLVAERVRPEAYRKLRSLHARISLSVAKTEGQ
jgi:hypothetical protein